MMHIFSSMLIALLYHILEMRYVAAYLLAVLGGNNNPSKGDVSRILESIGLDVEDEKLSKVMLSLDYCHPPTLNNDL